MDHLVGTPALKPYMHGYFISLKLYDAARVIANPYVYEEHRAKMVQEKLDKLAEGRIRTRKDQVKVKVNKALAEKITQEEQRAKKREERKRKKAEGDAAMDVDADEAPAAKQKTNVLSDTRFAALFEDPEFEVDEESREYALLNPSTVAQKRGRIPEAEGKGWGRGKTAVEDEDEESDKISSDGLSDSGESSSDEDEHEREMESEDSSEAGGTPVLLFFPHPFTAKPSINALSDLVVPRKPPPPPSARRPTNANLRLVPLQSQPSTSSGRTAAGRDASFGHRRSSSAAAARQRQRPSDDPTTSDANERPDDEHVFRKGDGSVEVSWVPTFSRADAKGDGDEDGDGDDGGLVGGRRPGKHKRTLKDARKGVERFGAGMEKGGEDPGMRALSEQERSGRTRRRRGMRSGSKNAFRQMQA
jgi:ribosome biogenesis protein ENP2